MPSWGSTEGTTSPQVLLYLLSLDLVMLRLEFLTYSLLKIQNENFSFDNLNMKFLPQVSYDMLTGQFKFVFMLK
jgi:hypothetical protein